MKSWYDENRKKVGSTNFVSGVRATVSRKLLLVSQCFPSFLKTCKNDSKFEYFVRKIKGKSFDYH